ncbi:hypothetical protein ACFQYP_15405 [Nonomuraea antimicrobica]
MTATDPTTTGRDAPAKDHWIAVSAVAFGTFLLVTAEQLPIGLLTPSDRRCRCPRARRG